MWFFDSILEEAPRAGVVSTPVTKKDEQDGSFLIIDDSVSANQLPDTAVQLFDAAPETVSNEVETASVPEVSFFSEPSTVAESSEAVAETLESVPSEIAFFDESMDGSVGDTEVIATMPEAEDSMEDVALIITEPTMEVSEESAVLSEMDETVEPMQEDANIFGSVRGEEIAVIDAVPEKNDIYAPLRKAIAEYDEILASHAKIAEAKDGEIAEYNARVAEAKVSAKKALEERKALETEIGRVRQMKELFVAQLS